MARDPLLCRKFYFFQILQRQRRPIFVEMSYREHTINKEGANIRDASISEKILHMHPTICCIPNSVVSEVVAGLYHLVTSLKLVSICKEHHSGLFSSQIQQTRV